MHLFVRLFVCSKRNLQRRNMFQVKENESVGFESRWKVKKVSCDSSSQTTEFTVSEAGTNTHTVQEAEVQTLSSNKKVEIECEYDVERLAQWLKDIYPKVAHEIEDNNTSNVFKGYRLLEDCRDPSYKILQTVKVEENVGNGDQDNANMVNAICWNCTGQVLAVTCAYSHTSWCYHTGSVVFYNLNSKDLLVPVQHKNLTTDSCITSVRFHPSLPSIIATGSYTGEICVWNMHYNEGDNVISKATAHEEKVTQVSWIHDVDYSRTTLLASSSTDGLLNVWNFSVSDGVLDVKLGYKIKPPLLSRFPSSLASTSDDSTSDIHKSSRGLVCFDFSPHIPDVFVVCTEGGCVVQCSVSGAKKLKDSTVNVAVFDPVFKYYEPCGGEIVNIAFSSVRKDIFMTNSNAEEIRIYTINQEEPAQVILLQDGLRCCMWVPHEETLLAGCGRKGVVEIFDVVKGRAVFDSAAGENAAASTTGNVLDINKKRSDITALGCNTGELQLWSCPWNLLV